MNTFEFLSYIETPAEKYLGVASLKCWGKIVLRFKIVATKDGKGTFPACASYKIIDESGERYIPAFIVDSRSEQEEIEHVIRNGVKRTLSGNVPHTTNVAMSASIQDDGDVPF
jgi:hypothetical protein